MKPYLLLSVIILCAATTASAEELVIRPRAPWETDIDATRAEARKASKPCVLIFNVDHSAL